MQIFKSTPINRVNFRDMAFKFIGLHFRMNLSKMDFKVWANKVRKTKCDEEWEEEFLFPVNKTNQKCII